MGKTRVAALMIPVLLAACSTPDAGTGTPNPLAGTAWRLAELQSNDDSIGIVRPPDPSKYEMTLGADGRAAFRLDCNRVNGRWESSAASQISFTPLAMTRAACPEGSLDGRVARELAYVRSYMIEGDRLRLIMMADGGSQVWARSSP